MRDIEIKIDENGYAKYIEHFIGNQYENDASQLVFDLPKGYIGKDYYQYAVFTLSNDKAIIRKIVDSKCIIDRDITNVAGLTLVQVIVKNIEGADDLSDGLVICSQPISCYIKPASYNSDKITNESIDKNIIVLLDEFDALLTEIRTIDATMKNYKKELDKTLADITDNTTDLGEVIEARGNFTTLGVRLNAMPYYFDSVADMKASDLKAGDYAITTGYYEYNDGGAGEYKIVVDDTLTDDGGSVHELDIGLKAILIAKDFTVKQFGAKGDNESDDTTAIQNTINYVENNNGVLNFGNGNYKITDALNISRSIKITGTFEKGLTSHETLQTFGTFINQSDSEKNIFNFSTGDFYGVEISHLRLNGGNIGINIDTEGTFSEFIFEKIHFNGGFKECILFDKTGSIGRISDCDFSTNEIGITANTLVSVTINDNNFWENSDCHIKFGDCEDLRLINNWFEKTVETGYSLLLQAPFNMNKITFLNNDFRSTKTPTIYIDGITDLTGLVYIKNSVFKNCRFSVGSNDYAVIVRLKDDNGVTNNNGNNSNQLTFDNCLFVNINISAVFTDYKWLYWRFKDCACYSAWTSGNKEFVTGESVITTGSELSGYKTNGVLNLEEISNNSLIVEGVIYKATDGHVKMFKHGGGKPLMLILTGGESSRPTTNLSVGMMYFDTTLKKPIFYNGTTWVDATGTEV